MIIPICSPSKVGCHSLTLRLARRLRAFMTSTSGAVSAEFVIILPALLMIFVLIVSASMLLVTSSEVQQVSFELTRGSLRYYEPGMEANALCASLEHDLAPSVLRTGNFLSPDRFTSIQCNLDSADALTVTVVYDLANHPAVMLGSFIGLDIGSFTRTSKMWL
ncbi:MAG: TadE family protein [Cypionkella sp.]